MSFFSSSAKMSYVLKSAYKKISLQLFHLQSESQKTVLEIIITFRNIHSSFKEHPSL